MSEVPLWDEEGGSEVGSEGPWRASYGKYGVVGVGCLGRERERGERERREREGKQAPLALFPPRPPIHQAI